MYVERREEEVKTERERERERKGEHRSYRHNPVYETPAIEMSEQGTM